MITQQLLLQITLPVASALVTSAIAVLNSKGTKYLHDHMPVVNRNTEMGKVMLRMSGSKLATAIPAIDLAKESLNRLADGEGTESGAKAWMKLAAKKALKKDSFLRKLVVAMDEEVTVDAVNPDSEGTFYRADDGNLISGLKE